jgi:hypothetical protein
MHAATLAEFANGDGNELGTVQRPGKMRSLRSSSALAVNFFDYWRYRPLAPLTAALGLDGEFVEFHFEQKLPTGLRGNRPNIDVVMFPRSGPPVGIECKFCEPYDTDEPRPAIDAAYFPSNTYLWTAVGLPRAQATAEALGSSFQCTHLDAGQLLKHMLALGHVYGDLRPVRLIYLWFDDGSAIAADHHREIKEFAKLLARELWFQALTYQQVFARLQSDSSIDPDYLSSLRSRYFAIA